MDQERATGAETMKAIFNGEVIAESDETIYLEGNHYFPPESVDRRYLKPSSMKSLCFWKGLASYYTIEVSGQTSKHAAWTYRHPLPWIRKIRNHVAFWNGVDVRT
jgi:uncharacterized protein (DUF427 family)